MNVYVVNQDGYDDIQTRGTTNNYFANCSCLNSMNCNVDCIIPTNMTQDDALYIVITHTSLLSTVSYEFTYYNDCVLLAFFAIFIAFFGFAGFIAIASICICCCCLCCCCYKSQKDFSICRCKRQF